jgi:uncharacterized protein (TIGR02145 family)
MQKRDVYMILMGAVIGIFSVLLFLFMFFDTDTSLSDIRNVLSSPSEVTIGEQTWMNKNLDVTTFRNGDPIQEVTTYEEWIKLGEKGIPTWCYYENDSDYGEKYGKLYNWHAVKDPRGLAPKGWHVPSKSEWETLISFLGGKDIAGKKLKAKGEWGRIDIGSNESGFSALPNGVRFNMFSKLGYYGVFWSTSVKYKFSSYTLLLVYEDNRATIGNSDIKGCLAVRCVKDKQ